MSELMSREMIEYLRNRSISTDRTALLLIDDAHSLYKTALAAHDIYDKAIEDAAQVAEQTVVSKPVWGTKEPSTHRKPKTPSLIRMAIAEDIRELKGTSNA